MGWISRKEISPPVEAELFFLTSLFIERFEMQNAILSEIRISRTLVVRPRLYPMNRVGSWFLGAPLFTLSPEQDNDNKRNNADDQEAPHGFVFAD